MSGDKPTRGKMDASKLDSIVSQSRVSQTEREKGYREKALRMYPWICGRCSREFTRENLKELTVHHRDHDHDNNPEDGSNWELLCIYCHENEHARQLDAALGGGGEEGSANEPGTHSPFAGLKDLLKNR